MHASLARRSASQRKVPKLALPRGMLGVDDDERMARAAVGIKGKRLTYRRNSWAIRNRGNRLALDARSVQQASTHHPPVNV